nr:zinc finger BED domain-containing protein DAYSLEEPER-like [Tanacetum cinerariifolium]
MMASSSVPTANTFFVEAWKIQLELTRASTTVVMDPWFKMQFVNFSFAKIFGNEAASYINIVDEGIHQLFLDYAAGGEMDRYMCTLKPQMVEALYYAKDWLCTESIKSMDSLVNMEFQI